MNTQATIANDSLVRIVKSYYDAVDALDPDRLADLYSPAPSTTLQFNADEPIVARAAIRAFTAQFCEVVSSIRHTMIEVWTTPLMGDVVPMNLPPERSHSTVTVVSTALPVFSFGNGPTVRRVAVPATSIFTIDVATEKFVSVHNMFDLAKVYAMTAG